MPISLKLGHNNPKRLRREFLEPLKQLLDDHRGAHLWFSPDLEEGGGRTVHVALFPGYEAPRGADRNAIRNYIFEVAGGKVSRADGSSHPLKSVSWSKAGRDIVELAHLEAKAQVKTTKKLLKRLAAQL